MDNTLLSGIIGAIAALIAAFLGGFISGRMTSAATKKATEAAFEHNRHFHEIERKETTRGVLLGLKSEIQIMLQIYEAEFIDEVNNIQVGSPFEYHYPIEESYFTVYEANAQFLGQIPDDDLRNLIVKIYSAGRGLIDTHRHNNRLLDEYSQLMSLRTSTPDTSLEERINFANKGLSDYGINIKDNYLQIKELASELDRKIEIFLSA